MCVCVEEIERLLIKQHSITQSLASFVRGSDQLAPTSCPTPYTHTLSAHTCMHTHMHTHTHTIERFIPEMD